MISFAVVEISGKQYTVTPNKVLEVDYLGDIKTLDCDKVLLISEGDKLSVGQPFLKDKLTFEIEGSKRKEKIRVATYHAKANFRKVKGQRQTVSRIKLKA